MVHPPLADLRPEVIVEDFAVAAVALFDVFRMVAGEAAAAAGNGLISGTDDESFDGCVHFYNKI